MKNMLSTLLLVMACHVAFTQGFYIEMKISSVSQGELGTMKMYSQNNNSRAEMAMNVRGMAFGLTSLHLADAPNTMYMLDTKAKTYSEVNINVDEEWKDADVSEYEVTVVGKEKVNGYNTTHVKVKRKGSKAEQELWTSTEVADYMSLSKIRSQYTGQDNLYKALAAKGAVGFPVRMKVDHNGQGAQIDLVKVEKRSNPASLFSLDGYTKAAGSSTNPIAPGIDMQKMIENMKNMTPEERQKMVEQMQKQYQPH